MFCRRFKTRFSKSESAVLNLINIMLSGELEGHSYKSETNRRVQRLEDSPSVEEKHKKDTSWSTMIRETLGIKAKQRGISSKYFDYYLHVFWISSLKNKFILTFISRSDSEPRPGSKYIYTEF